MISDYFEEMEVRINKYKKVHNKSHRIAAIKLLIWNIYFLFQRLPIKAVTMSEYKDRIQDAMKEKTLFIAMISSGGIGDHLLFANYLFCFLKKYGHEDILVDVFFKDKFNIAPNIFNEGDICHKYYEFNGLNELKENYDLVINLAGFPSIEYKNTKKILKLASELNAYVEKCEEYKNYCRSTFRGNAYGMMRLCELEGRKLIQRADVYGMLNISTKYQYPLFINEHEGDFLTSLKLYSKKFITIQTGCDILYDNHVKLWPIDNYKQLVKLINYQYPDLKIVQIGNSGECCVCNNNDNMINLVNKTNLEQAKILLKNSLLHIDIEGGMVHLRHALNGGSSIVLFGPTSIEFFGYEENFNIRSNVCNTPCYQLTTAWPSLCPKNNHCVSCMESISSEMVFDKFVEIMQK